MNIVYSRQHMAHDPLYMFENKDEEVISHYEVSERGEEIFRACINNNFVNIIPPEELSLDDLALVHSNDFVEFLKRISEQEGLYIPDSFVPRNRICQKPRSLAGLQGYYCTDVSTPFRQGTIDGLLSSAGCAVSGAKLLLQHEIPVFAITRPPGHHAGKDFYGGFCYVNNAALSAALLAKEGKTVLLDIDYHHGNGSQDIFYDTDSVFFVSLHADPSLEYPYYSGYEDETGTGRGLGCNKNIIFTPECTPGDYMKKLESAVDIINSINHEYLVISLGLDLEKDDPLGNLGFEPGDFRDIGSLLNSFRKKTLVVLEGGYNLETIGECTVEFLTGLSE